MPTEVIKQLEAIKLNFNISIIVIQFKLFLVSKYF